jgi:cation diffusion facilitator CzcD-associated flavoprotein CzcO
MSGEIFKVLVLGAGFAGIGAAIKLKEAGITDFVVLEKDDAIGGTWYENSYPGAACDVPSHFYCYSFNPNPRWSRKFAPQKEILQYINDTADKFDVRQNVRLGSMVERFVLDEKKGLWSVHLVGGGVLYARHILNGMGGLHKPSIPPFDGMQDFEGPMMHSAKWDRKVEFKNQRVAVIGSAASAIQIIPELQKICKKVDIYQRTPNYIAPRNDRNFSEKEKRRFAKWPGFGRLYRWWIYKRMELFVFPLTQQNSRFAPKATARLAQWVSSLISDVPLRKRLTPDYTIGCKRILLSDTYYQTLEEDNVDLVCSPVSTILKNEIRTDDGMSRSTDIIVFATGFDLQGHLHSIDVIGKDSVSLEDLGLDGEVAFKGASHSQFPNFHMITGPNTGVGTSSVVYMIELQLDYILKLIEAAGSRNLISVKPAALKKFNEEIQDQLSRTVWASGCDSWYIRSDGKIVTLYPGSAKRFANERRTLNLDHYDVVLTKPKNKD